MELEIMDKLQDIYQTGVEVEFKDFRVYHIKSLVPTLGLVEFDYKYDNNLTFDANINIIVQEIDKRLIKLFKKEDIRW